MESALTTGSSPPRATSNNEEEEPEEDLSWEEESCEVAEAWPEEESRREQARRKDKHAVETAEKAARVVGKLYCGDMLRLYFRFGCPQFKVEWAKFFLSDY